MGLAWWQIDGWIERLADLDADDTGDPQTLDEFTEAIDHISRSRMLSGWGLVVGVLTLLGAVGSVVGAYMIETTPHVDLGWSGLIRSAGALLATSVILGACLIAVLRLRDACDSALMVTDEATDGSIE